MQTLTWTSPRPCDFTNWRLSRRPSVDVRTYLPFLGPKFVARTCRARAWTGVLESSVQFGQLVVAATKVSVDLEELSIIHFEFYADCSTPSRRTVRGWGIVFTSSRDLVRRPPWKEEGGSIEFPFLNGQERRH
jgi:hypothetical protein